ADAQVLARQLIEVVQRRVDDLRAADAHGVELRDRRYRAGSPNIKIDRADDRLRRLGRVLERDRPPRRLRGRAQLELLFAAIDLDHDAVDLEGEVVTVLAPALDERLDRGNVGKDAALGIERKVELLQQRVRGPLRFDARAVRGDEMVDVRAETARRGELRILLPQRARRRVARIGELLFFVEPFVQLLEILFRDVDLAAHLEAFDLRVDAQRQRAHCANVRRDVVAAHAVAARGRARERAAFVQQIDRHAVDLQLRFIFDLLRAEAALDARVPLVQLLERV